MKVLKPGFSEASIPNESVTAYVKLKDLLFEFTADQLISARASLSVPQKEKNSLPSFKG